MNASSLFASGYETKPALSVPIHVVQLSDVPLELRNGAMVSPDLPSLLQYGIKNLTIRRGDTPLSAACAKNHWIRHQVYLNTMHYIVQCIILYKTLM